MTRTRYLQIGAAIAVIALTAWGASRVLERVVSPVPRQASTATPGNAVASVPHIIATLYYASSDGQSLAPVKREVPLADGALAQGRQIIESQLEAAPAPYVSVVPAGTTLRAFYVTTRGDAFVDLSPEVSSAHPGGSTTELLTVYALVNAITTNLSSVQRVQILIGGKEADTLAGHVDLRRPFERDMSLVKTP
jgi:hypothetical protein